MTTKITLSGGGKYLLKHRGGIDYFVCPDLDGVVIHGFSTRIPSGNKQSREESIDQQRRLFGSILGIRAPFLLHIRQVHGERIFVAQGPLPSLSAGEYDGAISRSAEVALSVVTADCLPILIYEYNKKIIGAVHAGWRGTVLGVLQNALAAIQREFGGSPGDCLILLGPSLRPCCFEIQQDVLEILKIKLPYWTEVVKMVQGKIFFDLQMANLLQAREMGVPREGIWSLDLCTFCQPGWFYSYRRDKGQTGRMVSMISLS